METPLFDTLMSAYFHEDWDLDHATEDDVLARFLDNHRGADLAREITQILERYPAEEQLEAYTIERLWPATGPDEGEDVRGWLTRLMRTVTS